MPEQIYPWQAPFICDVETVEPMRRGNLDVYADEGRGPAPAVVFVHGGPLPHGLPVSARDWPVYRGYASLTARAGLVGVTFEHGLHGIQDYSTAHADLRTAIDAARAEPAVDAGRVAVWAFSGGAPLTAPLLKNPPEWLRCLALTYPIVNSTSKIPLPDGYRPVEALSRHGLPIVLTRVGREDPEVDAGVSEFLARAADVQTALDVVEVPEGQHGFDALPPVTGACAAVQTALDAVRIAVTR